MFVRTKDNRIIKIDENGCIKEFNLLGKKRLFAFRDKRWSYRFENGNEVIKASENLEELIKGGDLIIVSDSNDNKLLMIYEKYYFDCWFKTHDNLISKMEWYIQYGNDYKLVATKQDKGDWKLYER